MKELEEGTRLQLDFGKTAVVAARCPNVIPVAVQNADTGAVILVAYTNEEAFRRTVKSRSLTLWSTSRDELWEKGRTSGNAFELVAAYVNCEQNSLLYRVRPRGASGGKTPGQPEGVCHTRNRSGRSRDCYYRRVNLDTLALENLDP
jgi:phosphoribosyl-AMP cyclohydrolase